MSAALLDERHVSINPSLIEAFGYPKAAVLQEIHYGSLEEYVGGEAGQVTMPQEEIADRIGLSRHQVHRAIRDLAADGVLVAHCDSLKAPKSYTVNTEAVDAACKPLIAARKQRQRDRAYARQRASNGQPDVRQRARAKRASAQDDADMPPYREEGVEEAPRPGRSEPHANEARLFDDPDSVEALCTYLADRVGDHLEAMGINKAKPKVAKQWRTDMDRLIRLGPTEIENSDPIDPQRVRRAIDVVFDRLATPNTRGFCWADQVQSPGALRTKWVELQKAARRLNAARGQARGDCPADEVFAAAVKADRETSTRDQFVAALGVNGPRTIEAIDAIGWPTFRGFEGTARSAFRKAWNATTNAGAAAA